MQIFTMLASTMNPFSTTNTSCKTCINGKDSIYRIRPFNSSTDQTILEDICKDVWNGTDYLPSMAKTLEQDDSCDFAVMLDDNDDIVAVGNRRIYDILNSENENCPRKKIAWIEAIRTSTRYRGKGIATALVKAFVDKSIDDGITEILSCTVEENFAMKKVFQRLDMKLTNKMYNFDFAQMRKLPGWSAKYEGDVEAQSILKALNIEHLVDESARSIKWTTINSEKELNLALEEIRCRGGLGHLPGLGKLNFYGKNVKESLQKGLIRKLESNENKILAIYALIEDPAIQSLKSKWVCCISTSKSKAFEAAIWDACSAYMISKRGGEAPFALIYDGCLEIDRDSALFSALPIQMNDPFIVYSNTQESEL